MTEMFGEAWSPMSVPDLAPDDDDDHIKRIIRQLRNSREYFPLRTRTTKINTPVANSYSLLLFRTKLFSKIVYCHK